MARKKINRPKGTLFISLLGAGFVLLLLPQHVTNELNFLFIRIFKPVLHIGQGSGSEVINFLQSPEDYVERWRYDKLWKEYKNIHADLIRTNKEKEKLSLIRSGLPTVGSGIVLARVISVSINGFRHELVINKGEASQLKSGQYVLCQEGNSVIGTISEVSGTEARVRLVTDQNHRIRVAIWREGKTEYIPANMAGDGKNSCKVPLLSKEYDILPGDSVYAAAQAGSLETERIIGEVTEVVRDESKPLLWDITVTPAQEVDLLTDVFVVVPGSYEE